MPSTYFKCIVPGCGNNSKINPQQAFFHLPKPINILEKWAKNMNLPDVVLKRQSSRHHYKVCMMHFEDSCFQTYEKKKLNRGVVPTIFNFEREIILEEQISPCQEDIPVRLEEISPTVQAVPEPSKNQVMSEPSLTVFGDEIGSVPLRAFAVQTLTMNTNNQKISVLDFNKICRICMSEGDLVNIFNHCEGDDCVFEMLACCTLIMVSIKDELPDKICLQCLDELKVAYKFYQKSELSDTRLQKLLEKSKQANQANSSPSRNSTIQLERMQSALKNKLDISTIKNDASVSLESDSAFENIHNDHDYLLTEKENSTLDESVLNCNEININSIKTSNSRSGECTKCSKTGFTYRELRVHWMTEHGAKYSELECEVCNKFIRFKEYKQHIRTHPEYRPYACDLCESTFQFKNNLERHQVSHLKLHSCDKCDKRFSRLGSLRVHITNQRCTSNLPAPEGYLCRVCNRWCPTKASLYQHSLIHGEKKYLCWYCGKGFTSDAGLITHVRRHTGVKPYKCSYCPKSFVQSSALKVHLRTHTGEKRFICEFCSKPFAQIQHLKRHTCSHTGVKPYKCSHCDKRFITSSMLKIHMRTHTGERPYICDVCGRGFHISSRMRRHMKIHARPQKNSN